LADLSRKRDRERLAPRREPYWQRLAEGAYVGFRRGPDTWVARFRGRDGKQQYKSLGEALDFDDAKRTAEAWLAQLAGSAVRAVKRGTVRDALDSYLADLRRQGRPEAAKEAEGRFELTVDDDPIAELELESATRDDFLEWRDRLLKGRQPRSVERQRRSVVAGLNRALELGHVGNPSAWTLQALRDDVEEGGETAVFLTAAHRKGLIAASPPHLAAFLRGLELTGARPSELAAAKVGAWDGETLRLAHRKGRPPKLRSRHVVLSEEGKTFFAGQVVDKLPATPIFTEDGEQPWRRHMWSRAIRAAITEHNKDAKGKARIPPAASAYSFRHARISELLQLHGIDPLTVAIQTGTSMVMIEKAYLRFIPSALREKLAAVKESQS
jgi:integrase